MLELLREVQVENFLEKYKNKELYEILEDTQEFNSYRSYFTLNNLGEIKTKSYNKALVNLTLLGNTFLKEYFTEGLFISEKRKIHKIDRLSDFSVEHLDKNLYKLMYNRDLNISYRYVKEFILKDKEFFIKKMAHYILLNDLKAEKALITLSFIKALEKVDKKNIDCLLYSYLPYLVTFPGNIENDTEKYIEVFEVEKMDLNGLGYLNLIKYGYQEYHNIYFSKLTKYLKSRELIVENRNLFEKLSEGKNELYEMWNEIKKSNL